MPPTRAPIHITQGSFPLRSFRTIRTFSSFVRGCSASKKILHSHTMFCYSAYNLPRSLTAPAPLQSADDFVRSSRRLFDSICSLDDILFGFFREGRISEPFLPHINRVIKISLRSRELADECFCQLTKQLNYSPSPKRVFNVLKTIYLLLRFVKPSPASSRLLRSYVAYFCPSDFSSASPRAVDSTVSLAVRILHALEGVRKLKMGCTQAALRKILMVKPKTVHEAGGRSRDRVRVYVEDEVFYCEKVEKFCLNRSVEESGQLSFFDFELDSEVVVGDNVVTVEGMSREMLVEHICAVMGLRRNATLFNVRVVCSNKDFEVLHEGWSRESQTGEKGFVSVWEVFSLWERQKARAEGLEYRFVFYKETYHVDDYLVDRVESSTYVRLLYAQLVRDTREGRLELAPEALLMAVVVFLMVRNKGDFLYPANISEVALEQLVPLRTLYRKSLARWRREVLAFMKYNDRLRELVGPCCGNLFRLQKAFVKHVAESESSYGFSDYCFSFLENRTLRFSAKFNKREFCVCAEDGRVLTRREIDFVNVSEGSEVSPADRRKKLKVEFVDEDESCEIVLEGRSRKNQDDLLQNFAAFKRMRDLELNEEFEGLFDNHYNKEARTKEENYLNNLVRYSYNIDEVFKLNEQEFLSERVEVDAALVDNESSDEEVAPPSTVSHAESEKFFKKELEKIV